MDYTADLNSSDNLLKIQKMMPIYMQSDWANQAQRVMTKGVVPNFSNVTEFVEDHARVCNTIHGKNVSSRSNVPKDGGRSVRTNRQFGSKGVTTLLTQGYQEEGKSKPKQAKYQGCSEQHWISNC